VRVAHDQRLGVDRFSTPELLILERQLVDGATGRTGEGCAVVRPELVRQVLDRHQTAGEDQAAMVRDLTQGGDGVAVAVGRAGSGKTWTLGLARETFELDGYQVLGCAPTGIATVGLADEGFTDARTVDRLLLDLQGGRTGLDDRTVLVVDEAAMVATRKLAPLLSTGVWKFVRGGHAALVSCSVSSRRRRSWSRSERVNRQSNGTAVC
jgi:hypothetical protein